VKKVFLLMICNVLFPTLAISAPSSQETKAVLDHYWSGDSPVLVEYKICSEIIKEGDNKNDCAAEVNPQAIKAEDEVYLWMNYMVPKDTEHTMSVLFTRNGRPEKSKSLKISSSLRYRTWTQLPTDKGGTYMVQVDRELGDNFTTMGSFSYSVQK